MADAKPDTWMPLVIGDYLKDTGRLTTEQHGAYLLLIMDYWVEGPPPDDDDELASITRLGVREWKRQRSKLMKFFRIEAGVWRHKRIDQELERWSEKKAKYAERAAAGGRAKAAKSKSGASTSVLQEAKTPAPQPASGKVEGPKEPSTLTDASAVALAAGSGAPVLRLVVPEPEPADEEILFEETARIDPEEAKAAFAELLTHIGSKRIP